MSRRLESRMKGLLEAPTDYRTRPAPDPLGQIPAVLANIDESGGYIDTTPSVQYLHRTVRDYLHRPSVWNSILAMSDPGFDPHLSLAAGYLSLVKIRGLREFGRLFSSVELRSFNRHVALSREASQAALTPLLNDLNEYLGCLPLDVGCLLLDPPEIFPSQSSHLRSRLLPIADILDFTFWVKIYFDKKLEAGVSPDYWGYMTALFGVGVYDYQFKESRFNQESHFKKEPYINHSLPTNRAFQVLLQRAIEQRFRGFVDRASAVRPAVHWAEVYVKRALEDLVSNEDDFDYLHALAHGFTEAGKHLFEESDVLRGVF